MPFASLMSFLNALTKVNLLKVSSEVNLHLKLRIKYVRQLLIQTKIYE